MIAALLRLLWKPLALLLAALGIYAKGRAAARRKTALEAAEAYAATRKEMDDATAFDGTDPDAARRWLRERDTAQR